MPETNYYPNPASAYVAFVPDIPDGSGGLSGAGSPEGVTAGNVGQHYWDTTNRVDYVKTSGTGTTGWEVFLGI
jgi:hypothetical protein